MARPIDPRFLTRALNDPMRPDNDNGKDACAVPPTLAAAAISLADGRPAAVALDARLHMRLRLACALTGRSAQAILSDALDDYLKTIPGIERLIADTMAEGGDKAAVGWGSDT